MRKQARFSLSMGACHGHTGPGFRNKNDDIGKRGGESQIAQCPQIGGTFTRRASDSSLSRAAINIEAIEHLLHDLFHEEVSTQMSIEHFSGRLWTIIGSSQPTNISHSQWQVSGGWQTLLSHDKCGCIDAES
jgi:hypothetical protein